MRPDDKRRHERRDSCSVRHDEARTDGLLAQIILQNLLLDLLHDMSSEETDEREIHPGIRQPKRIAGGDDTIELRQFLEPAANDLDLRMRTELPTKDVGALLASIDDYQAHWAGSRRGRWINPPRVSSFLQDR